MKNVIAIVAACIIAATIISATNKEQKMLRHVVVFKFKDDASPEDVKKVEDAFRALPSKIKEIKGFEWGTNNSPENLAQGFTHCFFLSFKSEEDRAAYLPHPAHKAFGNILKPYLDKVLVIDYWTKD
ncbi:Dabb family protein [Agriterribacter sp.]|uniref:Dabb family protein n=1 Tax=Agriterribacter sp. TaxID=2821509 RepID=UPI002CFBE5F9|nr:Dabb family protein [Agriterribacter sp.]HRP58150.1 Dabb family protein [Agriterribacter sp.]